VSNETPSIRLRSLQPGDAPACDEIVRSLPYHFGNDAGGEQCAEAVRRQSGLVAVSDDAVVGFLTWQAWFDASYEITWLAVHAERRRRGVGTLLVERLAGFAAQERMRFLLVTTLSASVPDDPGIVDGYAQTRAFYERRGFGSLWEPTGWWDETNQCLLMVRDLAHAPAG
jgi:ribosomal protein S18 acetylase RimI-like enzyme